MAAGQKLVRGGVLMRKQEVRGGRRNAKFQKTRVVPAKGQVKALGQQMPISKCRSGLQHGTQLLGLVTLLHHVNTDQNQSDPIPLHACLPRSPELDQTHLYAISDLDRSQFAILKTLRIAYERFSRHSRPPGQATASPLRSTQYPQMLMQHVSA
jgi:hypothetical protein